MRKHHRGSYLCTGLQVLLLLGSFVIGLGGDSLVCRLVLAKNRH